MQQTSLYAPELREMLKSGNDSELQEFCETLHPVRAAEFLQGLEPLEIWNVIQRADPHDRAEIFTYLDPDDQEEILRTAPREEIADFLPLIPSDDRVNLLREIDDQTLGKILAVLPAETRHDIQQLQGFPVGTCGSIMSTDFIRLDETMSVEQAIHEIGKQTETVETVYYLYVVDPHDHLVGLVSAKQLLAAFKTPQAPIEPLMRRELITIGATEPAETAAKIIAKYDFLALPVVDWENRLLGIITHDDVVDVRSDAVTEDVYRMAGIAPMEENYLEARFMTIWRNRVFWLACLFFAELFTFSAMSFFESEMHKLVVLAMFIPLCLSTGGNSGSQAATLIIRALALEQVRLRDWFRVFRHELMMGLALGGTLGAIAFVRASFTPAATLDGANRWMLALTICEAVAAICLVGTMVGCMLPLIFKRIGVDPALASSPFVATFVDCTGIMIYFTIAQSTLLGGNLPVQPIAVPTYSLSMTLKEPTPENKKMLIDECFRYFSDQKDVVFCYEKESASPELDFTIVFKNKASYERFETSASRSEFFINNNPLLKERKTTLSEIKTLPQMVD